jgi:hypothetical protein
MWNTITPFSVKEQTSEDHTVIGSELALCYHNVKHNLIYTASTATKLSHHVFWCSKVGSKLSCGRTEYEALVTKVLALSSITDFIACLVSLGQT